MELDPQRTLTAHESMRIYRDWAKRNPQKLETLGNIDDTKDPNWCVNYSHSEPVHGLFTGFKANLFNSESIIENIDLCNKHTKVRNCTFHFCLKAKKALASFAPGDKEGRYECPEWLLQALACWVTVRHAKVSVTERMETVKIYNPKTKKREPDPRWAFPPDMVVYYCAKLLSSLHDMSWRSTRIEKQWTESFYAIELLVWISSATDFIPNPRSIREYYGLSNDLLIERISPRLRKSVEALTLLRTKYCQRRVWNLVHACRSGVSIFPSVTSMLQTVPSTDTRDHSKCTEQGCDFDQKDTSSVAALHVCGSHNKDHRMTFDLSKLNDSRRRYNAWDKNQRLISEGGKFMTVSHVWLDGTGHTRGYGHGEVNRCLFELFSQIADSGGCKGIWWDAISIPSDREKRTKEIARMHENYSQAEFTLVYDTQLANLEWREGGSPCLALALSAWFTRGWTALELRASKAVKVLFKAPRNAHDYPSRFDFSFTGKKATHYVLKDLREILAGEHDLFVHAAYREASVAVRAIFGTETSPTSTTTLNKLLYALKHRHTSRMEDRMIIASLLINQDGRNVALPSTEITKRILTENIKKITPQSLFHGKKTISESGPWSWCPPILLDLEEDEEGYDYFLRISHNGELKGKWATKNFEKQELGKLSPISSDPTTSQRIRSRLKSSKDIIILDKRFINRYEHVVSDRYLVVSKPDSSGRSNYIGMVEGTIDWRNARFELEVILR